VYLPGTKSALEEYATQISSCRSSGSHPARRLIPIIVAEAMFAAALWTLGELIYEHKSTRAVSAAALEPLDAGQFANAPAPARSLP
jgi:hypothetical protein